eukprot:CAMPEP_0113511446 /NCGR_PEP_ID=MMETSP0014_2-20120614/38727_1 /TAXON_ID=2857 /ORGANISM="Nitzschia sp." /LENGTH=73 /DNA_ID=CAMNT_0000407571 /DNA_START=5 /DNA_END=223 /DNA_ORIENTATION=- /assembly_acc=CAM_ASM_000159
MDLLHDLSPLFERQLVEIIRQVFNGLHLCPLRPFMIMIPADTLVCTLLAFISIRPLPADTAAASDNALAAAAY